MNNYLEIPKPFPHTRTVDCNWQIPILSCREEQINRPNQKGHKALEIQSIFYRRDSKKEREGGREGRRKGRKGGEGKTEGKGMEGKERRKEGRTIISALSVKN